MFSLAAAVVSHAIARACASGDLPSCSCAAAPSEQAAPDFRWGGCGDNVRYGLQMGSAFSDAPMRNRRSGPQAFRLMQLHNNAAGRQVISITCLLASLASFSIFISLIVCLFCCFCVGTHGCSRDEVQMSRCFWLLLCEDLLEGPSRHQQHLRRPQV